ncbi:helix-turn-helix domain-containing protein [Homoserinimonas aerilata]|uniref:helix-turn-helix domain-containing protein n=1 Tax=Homoserinimonas aerilata TaxID=1162970 RepID=UPI00163A98FC|nr:helix-turn-helix domain-containing protein [Homoserinimonas aerilata]
MYERAEELIVAGYGRRAIASELGISAYTARKWVHAYQRFGVLGLVPVTANTKYPFELKLAAVQCFLGGDSKPEILDKFQIRSPAALDRWVRTFRATGEESLKRTRGRPPASTAEETVERKVLRLEMENAALKKWQALVAEEQRRD